MKSRIESIRPYPLIEAPRIAAKFSADHQLPVSDSLHPKNMDVNSSAVLPRATGTICLLDDDPSMLRAIDRFHPLVHKRSCLVNRSVFSATLSAILWLSRLLISGRQG